MTASTTNGRQRTINVNDFTKLDDFCAMLRDVHGDQLSDVRVSEDRPPTLELPDRSIYDDKAPVLESKTIERWIEDMPTERQRILVERKGVPHSVSLENGSRVRVHFVRTSRGYSVKLRFHLSKLPPYTSLGLPLRLFDIIVTQTDGLVVISGPMAQGKTFVLHSILHEINSTPTHRRRAITTVEDPIEFDHGAGHADIDQREVGLDTLSYFDASYDSLRSRDTLYAIGEARHPQTIEAAASTAQYACPTIVTCHGQRVWQTVLRLINEFDESKRNEIIEKFKAVLKVVINLRLLPGVSDGKNAPGRVFAYEALFIDDSNREYIGDPIKLRNSLKTTTDTEQIDFEASIEHLYRAKLIEAKTKDEALQQLGARTPDLSI